MISKERIEKLKRICSEATPGPWIQDGPRCMPWQVSPLSFEFAGSRITVAPTADGESESDCIPDAKFIAVAREALPAMILSLEEAREAFADKCHDFDLVCREVMALRAEVAALKAGK